ncbi:hypothetical protein EIP91_012440 [Steccherinum ochraceum]|uniref:BTB domain-containing protein n=1 Tax=Steccherinum ochraceum TaxID=92696 RepID=A0A4R0RN02_9APHY|nr:hypothetical protein EIP91_012440 [Steccherinum ochraceum]
MSTQPVAPQDATDPFNKPTADFILRSSDNVDFRVHKAIIIEASPTFEQLFGRPTDALNPDGQRDGLPVARLDETSKILDALLRRCYPVVSITLDSPQEVCDALDSARKFMMPRAEKEFSEQFAARAEREPLSFFAYATQHYGWEKEIAVAAKASLQFPFDPTTPQLQALDAMWYRRLHVYHTACGNALAEQVLHQYEYYDSRYQYETEIIDDGIVHLCSTLVSILITRMESQKHRTKTQKRRRRTKNMPLSNRKSPS